MHSGGRHRGRSPWRGVARGLLAGVGLAALAAPALAQDGIATDGTLPGTAPQDLAGPDYEVRPDHGLRVGDSQLYSFERFGLEAGESATFFGDDTIARQIARVTGPEASSIDGLLHSDVDAHFYFLNPNGVVIGENGRLDVAGDVTLSTADFVRLGEDGLLSARDPSQDVLTAAPISSFGFLSASPAPIEIAGARLETRFAPGSRRGRSLSLIGGDLELRGSGAPGELTYLYTRGGSVGLVSVAGPGEVRAGGPGEARWLLGADVARGDVSISNGAAVVTGGPPPDEPFCVPSRGCQLPDGSGGVLVRARDLDIRDGEIRALTVSDAAAGLIDIDLDGDLRASSDRQPETSGVFAGSGLEIEVSSAPGVLVQQRDTEVRDGEIVFQAEVELDVADLGEFFANGCETGTCLRARYPGTGASGEILVRARNVALADGGKLSSSGVFGGNGGDLRVEVDDRLEIAGTGVTGVGGGLFSNTRRGGDGGAIVVAASELRLDRGGLLLSEVRDGDGDGGSIDVDVERLVIAGNARIDTSTRGSGDGGTIDVAAGQRVRLRGGVDRDVFSGISTLSQVDGSGDAGSIRVATPDLRIEDGAAIASDAFGVGDAGTIDLRSRAVRVRGGRISASSASGEGGNLFLNGGPLVRRPDGSLEIDPLPGTEPGFLLLLSEGEISTSVAGGAGGGGDVAIDARYVVLADGSVEARATDGPGGNIRIAADAFLASESSAVDATSRNSTDGVVEIVTPGVAVRGDRPELPSRIRDAAALLRERCAARRPGAGGSFVIAARDGLPLGPAGLLPASMADDAPRPSLPVASSKPRAPAPEAAAVPGCSG